jgi:copper(I)-binding protein
LKGAGIILSGPASLRPKSENLDQRQVGARVEVTIARMRISRVKTLLPLALSALLAASLLAHEIETPSLKIGHPWARPTVPGQSSGGGYLSIQNKSGAPERLLGGRSPNARVELHQMSMEGSIMRMREIDGIDLPPGANVELKPGGRHIMLMDLKTPLKVGDKLPLILRFRNAGEVPVEMWVELPKVESEHKHH